MKRQLVVSAALLCLSAGLYAQAPTEKGRLGIALTEIVKPWTGDLDGMAEAHSCRTRDARRAGRGAMKWHTP